MLRNSFTQAQLTEYFKDEFTPFPTIINREGFDSLPDDIKKNYIKEAEKFQAIQIKLIPASYFMDFSRNGNRTRHANLRNPRRARLNALMLGECIENKGRFLDDIIDTIYAICEETVWCIPAHYSHGCKTDNILPEVDVPRLDLFTAATGTIISICHYLLGKKLDEISPVITKIMRNKVNKEVLGPFLSDNIPWLGFSIGERINNWNPWINSNVLLCLLLLEDDVNRKAFYIDRVLNSLDYFIDIYTDDGGCDEGASYWSKASGSLFDCLDILYLASDGKVNFYNKEKIKNMGEYLSNAHIYDNYYVNFADCGAKINSEYTYIYRYGESVGSKSMMDLAKWQFDKQFANGYKMEVSKAEPYRLLHSIFNYTKIKDLPSTRPTYHRDVYLPGIEFMVARETAGSSSGFYLACKGGHNDESHNHNDVGTFTIYYNSTPLLIDIGVETYTKKTFSDQRYDIWTMQSAFHNLPTINGYMEKDGKEYASKDTQYSASDEKAILSLDIAPTFDERAKIKSWQRIISMERNNDTKIIIVDKPIMIDDKNDIEFTLMLKDKPVICDNVAYVMIGEEQIMIEFDEVLIPDLQENEIKDERLKIAWDGSLYRLILTHKGKTLDVYKCTIKRA